MDSWAGKILVGVAVGVITAIIVAVFHIGGSSQPPQPSTSQTPAGQTTTPDTTPATQSAAAPVTSHATVSGVPGQGVPNQQVTMRGSGFPRGGALKVTFATGPGQDFPLAFPPPQQVDSQGSFTFTLTIDSMFCGYNGQINTYDFGGDGQLLTSNPLAVVC
jgi:hypothetical protein